MLVVTPQLKVRHQKGLMSTPQVPQGLSLSCIEYGGGA